MSKNYKHLNREERYSIKEMRDKGRLVLTKYQKSYIGLKVQLVWS